MFRERKSSPCLWRHQSRSGCSSCTHHRSWRTCTTGQWAVFPFPPSRAMEHRPLLEQRLGKLLTKFEKTKDKWDSMDMCNHSYSYYARSHIFAFCHLFCQCFSKHNHAGTMLCFCVYDNGGVSFFNTVYKSYSLLTVITKYWLYSPCCTINPCSLS